MKIKKGLDISTSDFWYDICDGGYLDSYEICKNIEDADKVHEAVKVLREFEQSCEDQIEGFLQ